MVNLVYLAVVKYRLLHSPSLNIKLDFRLQFYNDTTSLLIASDTIISNKMMSYLLL